MKSNEVKLFNNLNNKIRKQVMETKENYYVHNGKIYNMDGEEITDKYRHELVPVFDSTKLEKYNSMNDMYEFQKEHGRFVFMFYRFNIAMKEYNLNKSEIARLLYLITYIDYETNRIMTDNGRSFTNEKLCSLLKFKSRQYKEYVNKLIDNEVMLLNGKGEMFINHNICKAGSINAKQLKSNDVQYTRLFKRTVRDLFESSTVRELPKIANIYMVLPYINLYTNIVSYNPYESDINKVEPMSVKDLAHNLGYSKVESFKNNIAKTIIDNESVFGFFIDGEMKRSDMKVVINPKVVFASNTEHLQTIRLLFKKIK